MMFGAGLHFNGSRNGEGRFYSAAKARVSQDSLRRAKSDVTSSRSRSSSDESPPEKCKPEIAATTPTSDSPSASNLERFLESVTPCVPAQYLPKMSLRNWKTRDLESQPYFMLSDLWESFKEWSAYGVGVPLILNDHDGVVQYYVPYLSAIQFYTDPSKPRDELRRIGDESDGEYRDSSSDSEPERISLNFSENTLMEKHMGFQEGFSSDEGESESSKGRLSFGYFERDPPYCREPLANKISDLAKLYPELTTLKSCDILPSSWISVAWYPIYRIPTGPTLRDLDACFLTFHYLHTPETDVCPKETSGISEISLRVFGLAFYKYKSSLWSQSTENELGNSLLEAAEKWLNKLQVHHPDFSFFCRR